MPFFAFWEINACIHKQEEAIKSVLPADHQPLTHSHRCVCAGLLHLRLDVCSGACAGQLTEVLTDIFNLSLAQAAVPTCFKTTSIVLLPEHSTAAALMTSVVKSWLTSKPAYHPH